MYGYNNRNNDNFATAPYNFVSLEKRVIKRYKSKNDLPSHAKIYGNNKNDMLLSGKIKYNLIAETPIIISDGVNKKEQHFFKNTKGEYVIPGSSIRGVIRNNAVTLSLATVESYITDSRFLFRTFADNSVGLRREYANAIGLKNLQDEKGKSYSIAEKVEAGYIYQKRKDEYVIIPAKKIEGKSYYRITEENLNKKDLKGIKVKFLSEGRKLYSPYFDKISFKLSIHNNKIIVDDIKTPNKLKYNGYILGSGYINEKKKSHYIINEADENFPEIILKFEDVEAYKEDLNRKKLKEDFYELPKEIGKEKGKPVFYIKDRYSDTCYFGFTPYLRIFYKYSVHNGIPAELKNSKSIDYVKAIFGFSDKEYSYKSRVSFIDAKVKDGAKEVNGTKIVLGQPKATWFPGYLKQPNSQKTQLLSYNAENFEIRGLKHYWLKEKAVPNDPCKDNVNVIIYPLDKGTSFEGEIHFSNLHKDELGLLLWAIRLEEGTRQTLGMGKPYGYGQVKVENIELWVDNLQKKYEEFSLDYKEKQSIEEYIEFYKKYVKENYKIDLENQKSIQELITIKKVILSSEDTKYMPLSQFAKRQVLKTIEDFSKENIFGFNAGKIAQEEASIAQIEALRDKFNSRR